MSSPEVDQIVLEVLEGRVERFADIVEVFQGRVLAIVCSMLGTRQEAEDLTLECFERAFWNLAKYEIGTRFDHWIAAIARNVVRMELRRRGSRHRLLQAYHEQLAVELDVCDDQDEREEIMVQALKECLGELPEINGRYIMLRYTEGRTFQEIADLTERTAQAVQRAISRIRVGLRDCVQRKVGA